MNRILLLLALFASSAFAAERQVLNPDTDGNLMFRVYDGGVLTTPFQITGSTSNPQANLIDGGSLILDGQYTNSSTSNHFLKVGRSGQAVQGTMGYTDTPIAIYVGTTTNHPFHFRTNNTFVGALSAAGVWDMGPTTGGNLVHTFQSGAGTNLTVTAGGTNQNGSLFLNATGTTGVSFLQYQRATTRIWETGFDGSGPGGTDGFYWYNGAYRGGIGSTGNWSLGSDTTGGLNMNGTDGSGIWSVASGVGVTSCNDHCSSGSSESSYGFDTDSGICIGAWSGSTGAPFNALNVTTSCADVTSSSRRCLCAGTK